MLVALMVAVHPLFGWYLAYPDKIKSDRRRLLLLFPSNVVILVEKRRRWMVLSPKRKAPSFHRYCHRWQGYVSFLEGSKHDLDVYKHLTLFRASIMSYLVSGFLPLWTIMIKDWYNSV